MPVLFVAMTISSTQDAVFVAGSPGVSNASMEGMRITWSVGFLITIHALSVGATVAVTLTASRRSPNLQKELWRVKLLELKLKSLGNETITQLNPMICD